jgi:hypothetical protein
MQSILRRFLGFDALIGPALVKIVYYFGAGVIVVMTGFGLFMSVIALAGGHIGTGVMQMLSAPAVGAVALVYWRFLCELFMLAFLAYERLGEIRDRLPDYSQF